MMFLGPFRERQCQYCNNKIGKWSAVIGILNCGDCVHRMQMGQVPRCRKTDCPEPLHRHGRGDRA